MAPLAPAQGEEAGSAAGGFSLPSLTPGTGAYGGQGGGMPPSEDWRESQSGTLVPATQPNPTQPGAGSGKSSPAGTSPAAEAPASPQIPNWLGRMGFLDDLKQERDAANAAAVPAIDAPHSAPQSSTPASPPFGRDPLASQQPSVHLPATPRLTSEEMLKQAMTVPPNSVVAGRRVTLLDVLGQVTARSRRVEITHAYWQLARRLGEYRFCWEASQQIQNTRMSTLDSNLLAPAQQAADREQTAAELALLQAQYHLAEVAGLNSSGQLPLPDDSFHLGTYSTHFEKIFANDSPPGQTRLLHRTLPLQYRVIDVRTDAIHAAQAAYQEVARSYKAGQVDAADVLATLHQITVQKRAWIEAVARYNDSIADYALAIAGPETTGRDLVSILIKLSEAAPRANQDKAAVSPSTPQPTLAESPSGTALTVDVAKRPEVPTLAPPREEMVTDAAAQGVPPVPVDAVEKTDLSVAPASADVPVTEDGGLAADSAVKPAVADIPVPKQATPAISESENQEPSSAEEEDASARAEPSLAQNEEMPAEPAETQVAGAETGNETDRPDASEADTKPSISGIPERATSSQSEETADVSPRSHTLAVQTRPMVAMEEQEAMPTKRTVFRQPGPALAGQIAWPQADLVGLTAAVQAKKLTAMLLGDVDVICPDAEAVDLEDCLDSVAGAKRRAVIEAYWEASLRVAEFQVHRVRVAFLAELAKAVTLGPVGTADARAKLSVAQLDAKANLLEAEEKLLTAQYELTRRCDRSLAGAWLVPKTLPHAGDYQLHFETMPRQLTESWTLKRLAAIIPVLSRSLQDRAAGVVRADYLRMETLKAYQAQAVHGQKVPFDRVLSAVDQQAEECLEFLNVLATYNQSIGDYLTVIVPDNFTAEQLVARLVVR